MFILPPNCIVPSATPLTLSPVFPSFLYFISRTPFPENQNYESGVRGLHKWQPSPRLGIRGGATSDQPLNRLPVRVSIFVSYEYSLRWKATAPARVHILTASSQ